MWTSRDWTHPAMVSVCWRSWRNTLPPRPKRIAPYLPDEERTASRAMRSTVPRRALARRGICFLYISCTMSQFYPHFMPDTAANYLSKDKFEELTQELEHLKTVRRREIAEQLEYARSLGDLSENAEYEEARNLQAATEDRIRVIEEQISHARIIEHTKGNAVSLGSNVTIQKQGEKEEHVYEIVGSAEANMQERKISH